ncbi:MAG: hypothetical protein P4L45_12155 [Ignavibacteriaceae bacterium]|nr:hypothetical protein [Ignavibacteriaceae bacterium]
MQTNKIFFTVTLLLSIIFSTKAFCQYDITLKQEQKGYKLIQSAKIKSVTQILFKFIDSKPDTNGQTIMYNEFDSTGKCIHWIKYWPDGAKVEETNQYAYDGKGHISGITSKGMDGNLDTRTENTFDVNGNEIESNKYISGGTLVTTYTHKYDKKGRETEQTITKGSDPIPRRKVFTYNDLKNIIETDFFRQDTITYKYVTQYNSGNNPVEENQFTPEGEHTRRILYSYDSNGNQTECRTSYGDGKLISVIKYTYDKFGNILEETQYSSKEEPESIVKYNYDYIK